MDALLAILIGSWLVLLIGLDAWHRSRALGAGLLGLALVAIVAGSIIYETPGFAVWVLSIFVALHGAHLRGSDERGVGTLMLIVGAV